jgi:pimeloyl-ACP methyl ester carboxylesterase
MEARWLNRLDYPFPSNYFSVDQHRLHYVDEGEGETLLFVHGTPSWSFDFRNLIKVLSKQYRCMAIDHIGFGLSDKPEHYNYRTQNHSAVLDKFISAKQLNDITLIVHDFGGPIGLHVAIQHPEKIKRFVILNSWLWSSAHEPDFIKLSKILKSPLLPFLYRYLNFSPRFLLPNSFGDNKLAKNLLSQYTKPFRNPTERNGTVAFAKSLLNDQDWFESLWNNRHTIRRKPTLFIWGMKDKFVLPKYLEKFKSEFTNSQTVCLETCGHFPQEEAPAPVTKAIQLFMSESVLTG